MASASPTAILAVPDRPPVERPDAKAPEASDGQFAGLMAQFIQAPPTPQAPRPNPDAPAHVEQEPPRGDPSQAATAPPDNPSAAAPSSPNPQAKTEPAPTPQAPEPPPTIQAALEAAVPGIQLPGPSAPLLVDPQAKAKPTDTAVPIAAVTPPATVSPVPGGPDPATAKTSGGTAASAQSGVALHRVPQAPAPEPAQAGLRVTPPVPHPMPSQPQDEAQAPAPAPPPTPSGATMEPHPRPQASLPVAATPTLPDGPATPPIPTPAPRTEVNLPPTAAMVQAALAESGLGANAEHLPAAPVLVALDPAAPVVKPAQLAVPQPPPREAPQPATTASAQRIAPKPAIEETAPENKANAPSAAPAPDPQAAASHLPAATQTPVPHAPDGSSLAALSAGPKVTPATAATVPVAPLAAAPPPSPPMAQVEGGVRWMLKAGAQEAQLQLHPESLGQITIHLKVEGGEVHARLWVTEPASVQAVQEGRPHLELSLKEQGLQLGSFDLQQGQRPFQEAPSTPNHRDHVTPEALAARQEAPAAAPVSILNAHRVELYA